MTKLLRNIFLLAALAPAGCATIPSGSRLGASSPASPQASEGGYPVAQPLLMAGTNYAMSPQAEAQPMGKDIKMDMSGHGAQPMKMPEHGAQETAPSTTPKEHEHHEKVVPKP